MKWAWVGVIGLGVLAAISMAGIVTFLPAYFHGPAQKPTTPLAQVVVAAKPLEAMQIVDAGAIQIKKVPRSAAPEDGLCDEVQVVGRVLAVPLLEGQVFTRKCFVSEGSGAQLAAAMPRGMRAVGVLLADDSALQGLLYPGCVVDVIASIRSGNAEAVSRTLLQNVRVLAVEEQSIVSNETSLAGRSERNRKRLVTLMVDPEQAKLLQGAMQQGSISLAMRNPMDTVAVRTGIEPEKKVERVAPVPPSPPPAATWEVTILRNREPEVRKFTLAKSK